ncbi:MAG: carboxypeptidase-like regulatory domain-containing protein [Sphingobacteriales bacterium]|nr:MAG: carboxypeptidase-like regulatory domain-containing protein [Sphingobacteriales bacterium]
MNKFISIILILLLNFNCKVQNVIEGVVCSKETGAPLGFVNVIAKSKTKVIGGANTNDKGQFKFELPTSHDSLIIEISKVGYAPFDTILKLKGRTLGKKIRLLLGGVNAAELIFDNTNAKEDIENGIIQIYHLGLPAYSSEEMNKIASQYGFQYNFLNCEINEAVIESVNRYNEVVEKYLSKINSQGWQDSLSKRIKNL